MTTTIPNFYRNSDASIEITLDLEGPAMVNVAIRNNTYPGLNADRDAFLNAVRSELGVLIIDKADLPEVTITGGGNPTVDGEIYVAHDADFHRQAARASLALAEYLEAHPPVDRQQVDALACLIAEQDGWPRADEQHQRLARDIIATGKVTVQS